MPSIFPWSGSAATNYSDPPERPFNPGFAPQPWVEECLWRIMADMEAGRISLQQGHDLKNIVQAEMLYADGKCPTWETEPDGTWVYSRTLPPNAPQQRRPPAGPMGPNQPPRGMPIGSVPEVGWVRCNPDGSMTTVHSHDPLTYATVNRDGSVRIDQIMPDGRWRTTTRPPGTLPPPECDAFSDPTFRPPTRPATPKPLPPIHINDSPPARPGGTMTARELAQCIGRAADALRNGQITQAQFDEYVLAANAAAQRPGGTCPPLSYRMPPTQAPPAPRAPVTPRARLKPPRLRPIARGVLDPRNGAIGGFIGGVAVGILEGAIESCEREKLFWGDRYAEMVGHLTAMRDQYAALNSEILDRSLACVGANSMSPECQRQFADMKAGFARALNDVNRILGRAIRAREKVQDFNCTIEPIFGSRGAQRYLDELTALHNEAASTLEKWRAYVDDHAANCPCGANGRNRKVISTTKE